MSHVVCPHQHHHDNFFSGGFLFYSRLKFDRFQSFLFLTCIFLRTASPHHIDVQVSQNQGLLRKRYYFGGGVLS